MFTGIVEKIATVKNIKKARRNYSLTAQNILFADEVKTGDSIAVNGVCLTVSNITGKSLSFDIMPVTYKDTDLKYLKAGSKINLERALSAQGRFDGHIVTGHVDGVYKIRKIIKDNTGVNYFIEINNKDTDKIILKGSVCIEGISLTIQSISKNIFSVSIIPETLERTILKYKKQGDPVNIEFDTMLKKNKNIENTIITREKLASYGYF